MSLTASLQPRPSHDDTRSIISSRRLGHTPGQSTDLTASDLNRTSPLDFDFAKFRPLVRSGAFLEPHDLTPQLSSEFRASLQSERDEHSLRFSSNAGIIEQYSRSWYNQDDPDAVQQGSNGGHNQASAPNLSHSPRWPFINDDCLNTTDSVDAEPLFPSPRISIEPRQCHTIDEDLEDLAALYIPSIPEPEPEPEPEPVIAPGRPRRKVMTSAEFEALRRQRAREDAERRFYDGLTDTVDDYDKIDYDGLDEANEIRKQRVQRKKQQAHLDGYRQRMMKKTSGPDIPPLPSHSRVSSTWSMNSFKTFRGTQEDYSVQPNDDDEDDVPLALLQSRRRSDGKSDVFSISQPQSTTIFNRQGSNIPMPAFVRGLPQQPFPGNATNAWPLNNQQLIPGGLVGVIASEERAKAMRRVPPSHGFQPIPDTNSAFNWEVASSQHTPMASYHGMTGMPGMQMAMPPSRPHTPIAMPQLPPAPPNHEMFNFIQAQTDFLRTMASINQQRHNQPWDTFSSQQSVMNVPVSGARSTYAPSNYAKSTYQQSVKYAPSVAPSERSTVGLPSRYRSVSKSVSHSDTDKRVCQDNTATGNNWGYDRQNGPNTSTFPEEDSSNEEDDEAFWRAKKAKKERRKAMWIEKNDLGIDGRWII
ncbi:hypothetical protein FGRMN_5608 [Fusarium graminum]|nr:hypothetical protein FGRMN_5608 [Fusarium graminum]